VVRIDPKTGAMTATGTLPKVGDSSSRPGKRTLTESPDEAVVAWHNNQLAFLKTHINVRDAGDTATLVLK
jgi:hypothetical protein